MLKMVKLIEKYPVASFIILIACMLLIHLDVPDVTIMEARNFITAREMVLDENWLLTTMNGEPRYQKPPLPTWITAISGMLFGINSLFALRLPAVLMIMLVAISVYLMSMLLGLTKKAATINGLISLSSFYIIAIIIEAPWDIYTHGFMVVALYFIYLIFEEKVVNWKQVLMAALFMGASILSKGPISLYALFLPFVISYGITYGFKSRPKKIGYLLFILVLALIIGGWWYAYVRLADPDAFTAIASKETANWSSYNVKPLYYYWSFFVQSGIWTIPAIISLIYPFMIKRVSNKKAYKLTFWWTLVAVVLLSVIPEKKSRYLMPVLIPLAMNTGFYIDFLTDTLKEKLKIDLLFGRIHFILMAIIALAIPVALFFILDIPFKTHWFYSTTLSLVCIAISSSLILSVKKRNYVKAFILNVLLFISIGLFGLPLSKTLNKNTSYNSIAELYKLEEEKKIVTFSIGEIAPEILWDYKGKLPNIYKNDELILPEEKNFGLLLMHADSTTIISKLQTNYQLTLTNTYNLNAGRKTKERLIRQFYLVTKK